MLLTDSLTYAVLDECILQYENTKFIDLQFKMIFPQNIVLSGCVVVTLPGLSFCLCRVIYYTASKILTHTCVQ